MEKIAVSHIVDLIKHSLESQFKVVTVEAEISNLKPSSSGHWYFTLSDEQASLSCALFKMDAFRNPLIRKLRDGDKVLVTGSISVYSKRGTFQLIARRITPAGVGDLAAKFQRLKEKLSAQGYFDQDRKQTIPQFVKRIAVITAEHGAALQDFLNVLKRRSLWYDVVVIPTLVQGDNAAKAISDSLKLANTRKFDLIVLTRGGGSLEDLWAFNEEIVVRAVDESLIPVISAVGHQTDTTLSDLVADLRCETPTAAAEIISQPHTLLKNRLKISALTLNSFANQIVHNLSRRLQRVKPNYFISLITQKLNSLEKRLERFNVKDRLYELTRIHESYQYLDELKSRLLSEQKSQLVKQQHKIDTLYKVLESINPNRVLKRGYSYLTDDSNEVISNLKSFDKLKHNADVSIHFHDGVGHLQKIKDGLNV